MSQFTFNGVEVACIKLLAKRFENDQSIWDASEKWEEIGLSKENFSQVLSVLESSDVIENVQHDSETRFSWFKITPTAVQLSRYFEEEERKRKEPKDVYENLLFTLKRHPIGGWAFVVVGAITFVAFMIHTIASAIKDIKVIFQ